MNAKPAARIRAATRLAGAVLTLYAAVLLYSAYAFPFGGGEFHAMFAYSDGHLPAVLTTLRVYLTAGCAVGALLVAAGYPLHWATVALAASATVGSFWWTVYTFPHQSGAIHDAIRLLFLPIPPACFAACGGAHLLRERVRRARVSPAALSEAVGRH